MPNIGSLRYFLPELILIGFAVCGVVLDLIWKRRSAKQMPFFALIGLLVAIAATLSLRPEARLAAPKLFNGMLMLDPFALYFKVIVLTATAFIVLFSMRTTEVKASIQGEYYVLLLAVTVGMCLMVGASNLLIAYLALEMVSITSYILTGFRVRHARSSEAAFKYIFYGAAASGTMLFGFSILFGLTGQTGLHEIAVRLQTLFQQGTPGIELSVGVASVFVLAGLGYKIASVPFHAWSPDIYEGAPTPITAFLSVASKAAGFGLLMRFLYTGLAAPVASAGAWNVIGSVDWQLLLAIIAALTMTFGNLVAIQQDNIKRLLAYSSIAHGGYMLMAALLLTQTGVQATLFYLTVYLFMNLGAFLVVILIAERLQSEEIDAYRGLSKRAPFAAFAMSVFLFSLTGLPPFAGFVGKLLLFGAVIESNFYWLAVVGVLNSVVSLYYYMRVVKIMYLNTASTETPVTLPVLYRILLFVLILPTILLGIYWNPLYEWAASALIRF